MTGVLAVLPRLIVPGTSVQVTCPFCAVIDMGAPELQLNTVPNCHRSTILDRKFGAFARNLRPGPNGNSSVPLFRKSCVRWKASSEWFNCLFLGSWYS